MQVEDTKNVPSFVEVNNVQQESSTKNNRRLSFFIDDCEKKVFTLDEFQELAQAIQSNDKFQQYYGLIGFSNLVSQDYDVVNEIINANLLPIFLRYLEVRDIDPFLQVEALSVLMNITGGDLDEPQSVINAGALPILLELLKSRNQDVVQKVSVFCDLIECKAICVIGNIGATSVNFRDMILQSEGLESLISLIQSSLFDERVINQATWALSILCRGNPRPDFSLVYKTIRAFSKVIQESKEIESISDACWAISSLSDGPDERIEIVLQTNIVPSLLGHMRIRKKEILQPVLRIIGSIFNGNKEQMDVVLKVPGIVDELFELLDHKSKSIRREICWTLSNLAAGSTDQIHFIIKDYKKIDKILFIVNNDCQQVIREAVWILRNLTANASPFQMVMLNKREIFTQFCGFIETQDTGLLEIILDAIYNELRYGDLISKSTGKNPFIIALTENNSLKKLEELQNHSGSDVRNKVNKILTTFLGHKLQDFDLE